jgi:hypothetical protein
MAESRAARVTKKTGYRKEFAVTIIVARTQGKVFGQLEEGI